MRKTIGLLFFVLITANLAQAQEYKYHPIFIYNFSRYIEWPDNIDKDEFTVSVIGKAEAYREMVDISEKKKTIKNKKFVVRQCNSIIEAQKSDIVFITQGARVKAEDIQQLQEEGALVITELDNIVQKGSHINFIATRDSKLGFELNTQAASDAGFKVANALATLAAKTY
ncbi:MAG: YfiR family protein [Cyclobacteriaceae bacterium]